MKLKDQVALIIGGARGIGATIAHTFSKEGASIVLVDLAKMKSELDKVVQAINQRGGKAVALAADCSDDRQVSQLVDDTVRRFGKIDVLINSAGFRGPLVPVTEISEKEFDDVLLLQPEIGISLLPRGIEANGQTEKRQHRQHLRHRRPRRHGDARLALRRQVGRRRTHSNHRQRIWSSWHQSQRYLPRAAWTNRTCARCTPNGRRTSA